MGFPIIDICHIDDPDGQLSIAKEITDASKTWGFLLLKNPPILPQDIQKMFDLARQFFTLPPSEKDSWPINSSYVGYNAPLSDRKRDDKASMWLSGRPGHLQSSLTSLPPFWHNHLKEVERFKHDCHGLVIKLLVCFALAMDLPDRYYFAKAHAEDAGNGNQFRLLWYPPRGDEPSRATTRMSAHSDSGSITLLFQTASGLEVESPTGDWVPAPQVRNKEYLISARLWEALQSLHVDLILLLTHGHRFSLIELDRINFYSRAVADMEMLTLKRTDRRPHSGKSRGCACILVRRSTKSHTT